VKSHFACCGPVRPPFFAVGRRGDALARAGFFVTSLLTLLRSATIILAVIWQDSFKTKEYAMRLHQYRLLYFSFFMFVPIGD